MFWAFRPISGVARRRARGGWRDEKVRTTSFCIHAGGRATGHMRHSSLNTDRNSGTMRNRRAPLTVEYIRETIETHDTAPDAARGAVRPTGPSRIATCRATSSLIAPRAGLCGERALSKSTPLASSVPPRRSFPPTRHDHAPLAHARVTPPALALRSPGDARGTANGHRAAPRRARGGRGTSRLHGSHEHRAARSPVSGQPACGVRACGADFGGVGTVEAEGTDAPVLGRVQEAEQLPRGQPRATHLSCAKWDHATVARNALGTECTRDGATNAASCARARGCALARRIAQRLASAAARTAQA
jgi:hypothetical protein